MKNGNNSIYFFRRSIKVKNKINNFFNRQKKIKMITYERVKVAKQYIEKKYRLKKQEEEEKKKGKNF